MKNTIKKLHIFKILTVAVCTVFAVCPAAAFGQDNSGTVPELADGEYSVEVTMSGGSGKVSVDSPTLLKVNNGKMTAEITWSSSNYDYMIVDGTRYDNIAEEGMHSCFEVPVEALDSDLTFVADTTAMGAPHEITYIFNFPSASVGSKSMLPQEAAKRVLAMAAVIIIVGGILNHHVQKKRKQDFTGRRRTK
ncbi:MAG: hypothetical protein ACI4LO_04680 [Anaerovoracaceae bacterium]